MAAEIAEGEMPTSRQCSQSFQEGEGVAAAAAGGGGLVREGEGNMGKCSQTCEEATAGIGGGGLGVMEGEGCRGSKERASGEVRANKQCSLSRGGAAAGGGGGGLVVDSFWRENQEAGVEGSVRAVEESTSSSSSSSSRGGVGASNCLDVTPVPPASTTPAQTNQVGQHNNRSTDAATTGDLVLFDVTAAAAAAGDCLHTTTTATAATAATAAAATAVAVAARGNGGGGNTATRLIPLNGLNNGSSNSSTNGSGRSSNNSSSNSSRNNGNNSSSNGSNSLPGVAGGQPLVAAPPSLAQFLYKSPLVHRRISIKVSWSADNV